MRSSHRDDFAADDDDDDDAAIKQQKHQLALQKKRAADRNARRLERSRTKEHIAHLEERVQLLLRGQDSSGLVEKLLEENAALNDRVYAYQKQINSVKQLLENVHDEPIRTALHVPESDQIGEGEQRCRL